MPLNICCCQPEPDAPVDVTMLSARRDKESDVELKGYPAKADDSLKISKNEAGEKSRALSRMDEANSFIFTVKKEGPDDILGVDVRHLRGVLQVKTILETGAVARENKARSARGEEELMPSDAIRKVNGVGGDANRMVQEVKESLVISFEVIRP
eukprot:gnl/TRDRNA2_/TRDRNA2_40830_c0_seq2.p1 gnl/TRDRNA2_/TRDRNA2_40830_c0~~gnl/TRDRNA2_/TRDRNA2_40830_c0_seq2.p1  ORF type:complete len:154 (+),score=25.65 gnl/TRDRNA2_/TRDRNA2_40830_c0_seq2:71-532(+)